MKIPISTLIIKNILVIIREKIRKYSWFNIRGHKTYGTVYTTFGRRFSYCCGSDLGLLCQAVNRQKGFGEH